MEITFKEVDYTYQPNTPFEHKALKGVSFHIPKGSFTAIIGHTGSGKSTLIQQFNGLLRPTKGTAKIGEFTLSNEKNNQIKELRKKVGMVFQYPEHQLFEETVKKDILFGPKNFGFKMDEVEKKLPKILEDVGLDESLLERSPFELSGGQMRRTAIAGVMLMEPELLVLDEPTAGLDPYGKRQVMELFSHLHQKRDQTTVLVTHDMEDAFKYADQIMVLEDGKVNLIDHPKALYTKKEHLQKLGLDLPEQFHCMDYIERQLGVTFDEPTLSAETIAGLLSNQLKGGDTQ
ncbi:energy-coupling factor transporter ATPase [Halalkalibacillus halophilus]|uniref:energy-coupling factor transporter ATPase n=1 Tax=Halalkalibacillus halophilus TaxID=392827 RepID=UPI000413BF5C|nr:energy-coupling factor transporter ATPase [Halalkalibacillus halophilus]